MSSTPAPSRTEQNPVMSVQTWTPQAVESLIGQYPEERFIALFPRTVLSQVNPMLSPVIETVILNPDPENGGDVYRSNDLKEGHVALTKVALRRVMSLAGVSMVDSRRMDDGSDPYYVLWQVTVERQVPGRPRPERAIGTKEIRLGPDQTKGWTPARTAKAREHMIRMAEAKACNAALRDLLTLKQQYPIREIAKPFVVMRWEPNMNHPAVAERFLDNLLPASAAAYGPQDQAPQLTTGDEPAFELAPKVADEDGEVEGQFVEVRTNGHATVERSTGEVVTSRPAPDFGVDDAGFLDFGAGASTEPPTLQVRLAALVDGSTETAALSTDAPTIGKLQALLRPLGNDAVQQGVQRAFGVKGLAGLEVRHGKAILAVADTLGDEPLRQQWRDMIASADR